MAPLIAFIIGAGKNIGAATASALKGKGYQVAVGSRKPVIDEIKKNGYFPVAVDASNAESVQAAFAQVNKELGAPSVVIFNAAALATPPVPADPLSLSLEDFKQNTNFGVGVYAAAQEALRGFRSFNGTPTTFIVTGNSLPWNHAAPGLLIGLNVQKVIEWRLAEILSQAYSKDGFRFYFTSLVGPTGNTVDPISDFFTSGPLHAQVYLELIERKDQADWQYAFTLDGKQWTK
ncbi:hypothetical protein B0H14DRAFT_2864975 [Mycena olivaceomarginata]|nr:hypothetical protein B0H14DRAFT_2864975 [Mycena olivaceomarginata]